MFYSAPRESWTVNQCSKVAASAPPDHWGNRPPAGIVVSVGAPHPRYGLMRYNGGVIVGDVWYSQGTLNPWPWVPEPYGLFRLPSWGIIITTTGDGAARGLEPLKLNPDGFEI